MVFSIETEMEQGGKHFVVRSAPIPPPDPIKTRRFRNAQYIAHKT